MIAGSFSTVKKNHVTTFTREKARLHKADTIIDDDKPKKKRFPSLIFFDYVYLSSYIWAAENERLCIKMDLIH